MAMTEIVAEFQVEMEEKGITKDVMRRKIEERVRYLAAQEEDQFWAFAKLVSKAMHLKLTPKKDKKHP